QVAHVALVPDPGRDAHGVIGFGVDRAVFGVDRAPAAFGLDRAMRRLETGPVGAGPDTVRALVETVAHRLRTDLYRLEKDVVFRGPLVGHDVFSLLPVPAPHCCGTGLVF